MYLGKLTLDGANEELRAIIMQIWPRTSEELLDKIVPKAEGTLCPTSFPGSLRAKTLGTRLRCVILLCKGVSIEPYFFYNTMKMTSISVSTKEVRITIWTQLAEERRIKYLPDIFIILLI